MSAFHILYENTTGKITGNYIGSAPSLQTTGGLLSVAQDISADTDLEYVLNGVCTDRPINSIFLDKTVVVADGIDIITFTNIPTSSTLRLIGTGVDTTVGVSGTETITFDTPGDYSIHIVCFPETEYFVDVVAT